MYFIEEGLKGIRRHLFVSIASVGIMAACLVLTASVLILAKNLDYNLEHLLGDCEFAAYTEKDATQEETDELIARIMHLEGVVQYTYTTAEEAMDSFVENRGGKWLYHDLPYDLFGGRYIIQVADDADVEAITEQVKGMEGIESVSFSATVTKGFQTVKKTCLAIAGLMALLLLMVSVFIITNSTRLAMQGREEEIMVMKMVGATNFFIRAPFVVEGAVMGWLSGALAFALECSFYMAIKRIVEANQVYEVFTLVPFHTMLLLMIAGFSISGLFVGVFGGMVAIHRLLN